VQALAPGGLPAVPVTRPGEGAPIPMIRRGLARWRQEFGRDWVATPRPVTAVIFALVMLGLAAVTAQVIGVAGGGVHPGATQLAWVLAGTAACGATLLAAVRVRTNPLIRQTWLLYGLGAGCWAVGALIRIVTPAGLESIPADIFFLVLPVSCIISYARRVPRPYLFLLFVLDAIPVILLILALTQLVRGGPEEAFSSLFAGLYLLLAANAIQMLGIHRDPRRMPIRIWLFTLAFCVMAFASLFAEPHKLSSGALLAMWAGAAWTLGLLLLGIAGVARVFRPSGFVVLLPAERQSGPHAIPPTAALVGLIVLVILASRPSTTLRVYLGVAALLLLARVYLLHRQDLGLVDDVGRSRERLAAAAEAERARAGRLRQLAEVTSQLKSLVLDELLQTFCASARSVLGARYAAVGLTGPGPGFSRFVAAGVDGPDTREGLRPDRPVRLDGLTRDPQAAGFRPGSGPDPGAFLGVPVAAGDSVRGALYLAGKEGGFTQDDQTLARLLAASGGHAIVNAELYSAERRQQEQLASQNERLRELDRLKDEFIGLVSHELRTPLTSIIGYVELLRDEDFTTPAGDYRHFADVIDRNARRLLRLVGDLLFLSGIQSGKMQMDFSDNDLGQIAQAALEEARPEAGNKRIDLTLRAAALPPVSCDPIRIGQLLDNLVSNALKFTPPAGRIEIRLGRAGGCAVLEVADTGAGIPAADRERIFERFFRSDAANRQAVQGTGLGLTICKAIVDAHDGTISVDSEEGRGTTFRIMIPLHRTAGTRERAGAAPGCTD
jgi:signal transduction histidine kinase